MRKLLAALFCMMLGGGFVYLAFQYHLVRAADEYALVPKSSAGLVDTYVDVRSWDAAEWRRHPALVRALVKQGRSDLVVAPTARGLLDDLLRPFRSADHNANAPRNQ
jgi:hypothetical protein